MNMRAPTMSNREYKGFAKRAKPLTAAVAGVRLLMNLQETKHVFTVFDAIDGSQTERNYQRYLKTAVGARLDREGVNFADILSDKSYLRSFAPGSLAASYLEFLSSEDLDMELLMIAEVDSAASTLNVDPSRRNFIAGGFAIHDLIHVLTGYGRDAIGEACVLAFTAEQLELRGVRMMSNALAMREQLRYPGKPMLSMTKQARQLAREAVWLPEVDWREYLGLPLDEARLRLRINVSKACNPGGGALEENDPSGQEGRRQAA